ncbi:MAG: hypothetical protein KZQ71_00665 [Candidatus Thiodiazotropha sp. (ex Lucinoma aequizonata)]|nr:hypothetical protein [Candidatus Thiodiazotropha sp. (ex Lucinoma aequizonata)]MCU7907336.1 hypothetical protein [Candidatus Thiodiazotropha sp. (ex Lucinoma aequizonata)]
MGILSNHLNIFNLESAVEHIFVENPGVPGKTSFAVNGYSLNKNDNAAGCVWIFHNPYSVSELTQWVREKCTISIWCIITLGPRKKITIPFVAAELF